MKLRLLVSTLALVFSTSTFATDYKVYSPLSCRAPEKLYIKSGTKVDQRYLPPKIKFQGKAGTCYAFATQILLDYFYSKSLGIRPSEEISVTDLVFKYKRGNVRYPNTGNTGVLLQKVKNAGRRVCLDSKEDNTDDYDRFFGEKFDELKRIIAHSRDTDFLQWLKDILPASTMKSIESCSPDKDGYDDFITSILPRLGSSIDQVYYHFFCKKQITLPPFNVESETLTKLVPTGDSKEEMDKFDAIFSAKLVKFLKRGYPVSIAASSGGFGHIASVSGVRERCCGNVCHTEWQVFDSLFKSPAKGNWILASELSGSSELYQILPCHDGSDSSELPQCDPFIKGATPLQSIGMTDDLAGFLEYQAQNKLSEKDLLRVLQYSTMYGGIQIPQWFIANKKAGLNTVLPNKSTLLQTAKDAYSNDLIKSFENIK